MAPNLKTGSLANQSKGAAVFHELRRRIVRAELEPGAAFNQEQLAAELGVSTTPLREALRSLESEGLIITAAHREAIIAPLDPEDLVALYEVRENLDPLAASLAASRHTEEDAATIRRELDRTGGPDVEDPVDANRRYHAAIYRASHNPVLIETLEGLWDRSERYRRSLGFMADAAVIQADHVAIAEAVLAGQAAESSELMRRHIQRTRIEFERLHDTHPA